MAATCQPTGRNLPPLSSSLLSIAESVETLLPGISKIDDHGRVTTGFPITVSPQWDLGAEFTGYLQAPPHPGFAASPGVRKKGGGGGEGAKSRVLEPDSIALESTGLNY